MFLTVSFHKYLSSNCMPTAEWSVKNRRPLLLNNVVRCRAKEQYSLFGPYCWFSHDVTKIQPTKLLILLRFYFHVV